MTCEEVEWATLDRLRDDIRTRAAQMQSVWERVLKLGGELDRLTFEVAETEDEARARKPKRRRGRKRKGPPKGPSVVDLAVMILRERGGPVACEDLAQSIRARGVDSGNNERSLRMSAGKGRRLRGLEDDYITLA
jgi:hypothetical protein